MTQAELSKLVKRANTRLRALEKAGYTGESTYSKVELWYHKNAKFMATTSKGQIKFRTDIANLYKTDRQSYYKLITNVQTFLGYATSKVSEVKKYHQKSLKTFENKYKIKISEKQARDIFASEKWRNLLIEYPSDEVISLVQQSDDMSADGIKYVLDSLLEERKTIADLEREFSKSKGKKKRGF